MSTTPTTSNHDPTDSGGVLNRRVLVLAPFGRDAVEIRRVLLDAGLDARCCADIEDVCREIDRGASAFLVAEEALDDNARALLSDLFRAQPAWSDFPVVMMTSRSRDSANDWNALHGIDGTAHLNVLERPVHISTLVSSVRTAMRARERQYQIRDALVAREHAERELRKLNRTLETRVQERTADLEARNRDLQNFAYLASHDLREPLRKIQTFAHLVVEEEGGKLGDDARTFLERMAAAAVHMDGLLQDLLAFSQVGTRTKSTTIVRVGAVVADVLNDFDLKIRETGATVEVDADTTVEADRPQLRQLLTNLISNALKFHRSTSPPRLCIRSVVVDEPDAEEPDVASPACRITVEDEGVGFDSRFAERIFEPFERLHGQGSYEGTGMGLAICKRIAQVHGGTIRAESTPGEGTRFVVLLPMRQSNAENGESPGSL